MRKASTAIKPKGLNDEVVEIVPLNGASDTANAFVEAVSESGQQPVLPIAQVDTYHRDIFICPASNRMVAGPSPGPMSLSAPVLHTPHSWTLRPLASSNLRHAHHSLGLL